MKLSELLKHVVDVELSSDLDVDVSSVVSRSGECESGSLFAAIKGTKHNGADYIADAYQKGARAFLLSERKKLPHDSVGIYSNNVRKTLAELSSAICENPERKMIVIGITGTKGKTTTAVILSKILVGVGVRNIVVGTNGVYGMDYPKAINTTPEPTYLFPLLKKALKVGVQVVILEVSSQALKDYRVYGIPFEYVAFTGIGKDHVGEFEHPDFKDYICSKRSLFNSYGAKCAIVNYDDDYSAYMSANVPKTIKCGISFGADYRISGFAEDNDGAEFKIGNVKISTNLQGLFNARNITLALALAQKITGYPLSELSSFVYRVRIEGRFERAVIGDKNLIVDYAHNADSFKEITTLTRKLFGGHIICVFGSVGDRSYNRRAELASVAEKYGDFSVITIDNTVYEFPLSVCADIYSSFKDKTKATVIPDREQAIFYAYEIAMPGDSVLILGKGHERTLSYSGKTIEFSDIDVVSKLKKMRTFSVT